MKGSVLIASGGTGGHISPGVALAEGLRRYQKTFGYERVYIHSLVRNKDNPDLLTPPCEVIWHNLPKFSWPRIPLYPFLFLLSFVKSVLSFRGKNIQAVIGMGGYSSVPAILYALLFRKPLYLCEQNCVPGKITRLFAPLANKVALSFPLFQDFSWDMKVIGNPIRERVLPTQLNIRQNQNLHEGKRNIINVLVLGGSQGARQLNQMILKLLDNRNISEKYKFRILTGTNLYEETISKAKNDTEIISYSDDMKPNYEWANIVIARSGAGVLAECLLYGLPMILIPYPFAADNHQKFNAKYAADQGAAFAIETESDDPTLLAKILLDWKEDSESLRNMGQKSLSLAQVNASYQTLQYFFHP